MAYFTISHYKSLDSIKVVKYAVKLYYVQTGVYSAKENMEEEMKNFSNYIYNIEDNNYHAYIGVSKNKPNAIKIQNAYKESGIDTILKENVVSKSKFIDILRQYDELLSKTDDSESIKVISKHVLAKYEEYENER